MINQPRNVTSKYGKLTWATNFGSKYSKNFEEAQKYVDQTVLRKMDPLTPMRTGQMIQSATRGTTIGSGLITYDSPYARRQYYENQGGSPKHPQATHHWFERMKAQYKEEIRKGVAQIASGH